MDHGETSEGMGGEAEFGEFHEVRKLGLDERSERDVDDTGAESGPIHQMHQAAEHLQSLVPADGTGASDDEVELNLRKVDCVLSELEQACLMKVEAGDEHGLTEFTTRLFQEKYLAAEEALIDFVKNSVGLAKARAILTASSMLSLRQVLMSFQTIIDAELAYLLNEMANSCVSNIGDNVNGVVENLSTESEDSDNDLAGLMQAASASLGFMIEGAALIVRSSDVDSRGNGTVACFRLGRFSSFFDGYLPVLNTAISCTSIAKTFQELGRSPEIIEMCVTMNQQALNSLKEILSFLCEIYEPPTDALPLDPSAGVCEEDVVYTCVCNSLVKLCVANTEEMRLSVINTAYKGLVKAVEKGKNATVRKGNGTAFLLSSQSFDGHALITTILLTVQGSVSAIVANHRAIGVDSSARRFEAEKLDQQAVEDQAKKLKIIRFLLSHLSSLCALTPSCLGPSVEMAADMFALIKSMIARPGDGCISEILRAELSASVAPVCDNIVHSFLSSDSVKDGDHFRILDRLCSADSQVNGKPASPELFGMSKSSLGSTSDLHVENDAVCSKKESLLHGRLLLVLQCLLNIGSLAPLVQMGFATRMPAVLSTIQKCAPAFMIDSFDVESASQQEEGGLYYRTFVAMTCLVMGSVDEVKAIAERNIVGQVISPSGDLASFLAINVWAFLLRNLPKECVGRHADVLLFLLDEAHCSAFIPHGRLQGDLASLLIIALPRSPNHYQAKALSLLQHDTALRSTKSMGCAVAVLAAIFEQARSKTCGPSQPSEGMSGMNRSARARTLAEDCQERVAFMASELAVSAIGSAQQLVKSSSGKDVRLDEIVSLLCLITACLRFRVLTSAVTQHQLSAGFRLGLEVLHTREFRSQPRIMDSAIDLATECLSAASGGEVLGMLQVIRENGDITGWQLSLCSFLQACGGVNPDPSMHKRMVEELAASWQLLFRGSEAETRVHVFNSFKAFAQRTSLVTSQNNVLEKSLPSEWKQEFTAFLTSEKTSGNPIPPLPASALLWSSQPEGAKHLLFGAPLCPLDPNRRGGKRTAESMEGGGAYTAVASRCVEMEGTLKKLEATLAQASGKAGSSGSAPDRETKRILLQSLQGLSSATSRVIARLETVR